MANSRFRELAIPFLRVVVPTNPYPLVSYAQGSLEEGRKGLNGGNGAVLYGSVSTLILLRLGNLRSIV